MGLKRTKLQAVQSVTGITTVGIFTVGVTNTGGPVGVASTTYVRGVIMHNTGLATATSALYIYPGELQDQKQLDMVSQQIDWLKLILQVAKHSSLNQTTHLF